VATDIIEKSLKSKLAREAARKAREEIRKGKTKGAKENYYQENLLPLNRKIRLKMNYF
jgi:uncharacterized protein YcsI (UPF0317 family)